MAKKKRRGVNAGTRKVRPAQAAVGSNGKPRLQSRRVLTPGQGSPGLARPCVVGIGASAGGFEATATLLAALPADFAFAIVVIQHLDPRQPSQAAQLLARRTALTVEVARDGIRLEANHVYTVPSDRDACMEGERLRLVSQPDSPQPHLPVDRFFRSLGESLRERAIGIVLSGTGSDGSLGLEQIAAHGGIVLVQEPVTAQYDGMPANAIATGAVSSILSLADMPAVLCEYARHPYAARRSGQDAVPAAARAPIEQIITALRRAYSLDFSGYKPAMVMRRIERRMGLRRVVGLADYAELLSRDSAELDALRRDLLIGVTGFFRDPEAWQVLERDVIEPLMAGRADSDPVRVWVAGVATGEEAYSIAMVLLEVRARLGRQCALQVFATDASEEAIAFARRGRYPAGIAAQVSTVRLRRFFEQLADDQLYQVRPELRACVTFGSQMLIDDPPFTRLDLVSCRNVLMYLQPAAQQNVLRSLEFALHPGGFLFLGTAESIAPGGGQLRAVSKRWCIYRRTGTSRPAPAPASELHPDARAAVPARAHRLAARLPQQVAATAERILLERYCAAAFLVNRAGEALYLYGYTEPFLARRSGAPSHDLLAMLRTDLRAPLRRILRRAFAGEAHAEVADARVRRDHGAITVRMTVVPADGPDAPAPVWLVVLQDTPARRATSRRQGGALPGVVRQLEDELHATQHDLRSSAEQFEDSSRELKIANDELVTVNEELQVANEELQSSKEEQQSSKEELQSLNEELQTVNQQLQSKVAELETSNSDLDNLLASSQIITLCFDRNLLMRWYAPKTGGTFQLRPGHIGRSIAAFDDAPLGKEVVVEAWRVMAGGQVEATEVAWKGRWYLRRVLPYKGAQGTLDGVIVTLTDNTESWLAAEAKLAARVHESAELEAAVVERTRQLRELSLALELSEERERRAIAENLHDDLGQLLALLKMRLDLLQQQAPAGPLTDELAGASKLLLQASDRVRSLAFQLSPAILHELGLVPALGWLCEEMKRLYSLQITLDADAAARENLEPGIRTLLFRSVRELLINVGKHARTDTARVECRRTAGYYLVVVADSGKGFDPQVAFSGSGNRGFGLLSIRERLIGLGGSMDCQSVPGDGCRVTLRVPAAAANYSDEVRS